MFLRPFVVSLTVVALQSSYALARTSGSTGYSGNPANGARTCTSCHSGGAAPSVSISGPTSVTPGSRNQYTLTVTGGERLFGGFDVSATGGTLAPGSDNKLLNNEIVHSGTKSADASGNVSWTFNWTAPASGTSATLYGSGLSSSGNGTDQSMSATANLPITIAAAEPAPTQPAPTTPAPTAAPTPTMTPTPTQPAPPEPTTEPVPTEPVPTEPAPTETVVPPAPVPTETAVPSEPQPTATAPGPTLNLSPRLRAPSRVEIRRGSTEPMTIQILVSARSAANAQCGTVTLEKNGTKVTTKDVCPRTQYGRSAYSVTFEVPISAQDAGTVQWGAYFTVNGQDSAKTTVPTRVKVGRRSGADRNGDDDHDEHRNRR